MNIIFRANLSQLHLIKLFHWWMIKEPKWGHRPRGFGAFIYYAEHRTPQQLCDAAEELGELLIVAQQEPSKLAKLMINFEKRYWLALVS